MKRVGLMSLLIVGTLMAIPIVAQSQAVVIKDTSCNVFDPSLTPFTVFDTIKVITPSKNLTKKECELPRRPSGWGGSTP